MPITDDNETRILHLFTRLHACRLPMEALFQTPGTAADVEALHLHRIALRDKQSEKLWT
jgi:hypothetical protein